MVAAPCMSGPEQSSFELTLAPMTPLPGSALCACFASSRLVCSAILHLQEPSTSQLQAVQVLLSIEGADKMMQLHHFSGYTPFAWAASHGNWPLVKIFLSYIRY